MILKLGVNHDTENLNSLELSGEDYHQRRR